jgi:hypothetical protein
MIIDENDDHSLVQSNLTKLALNLGFLKRDFAEKLEFNEAYFKKIDKELKEDQVLNPDEPSEDQ